MAVTVMLFFTAFHADSLTPSSMQYTPQPPKSEAKYASTSKMCKNNTQLALIADLFNNVANMQKGETATKYSYAVNTAYYFEEHGVCHFCNAIVL